MELHGILSGFGTWNSMEIHGGFFFLSWNFREFHGFPWRFFFPWNSIEFSVPWNFFMEFYGVFPCTSMKPEKKSLFSWNSVWYIEY